MDLPPPPPSDLPPSHDHHSGGGSHLPPNPAAVPSNEPHSYPGSIHPMPYDDGNKEKTLWDRMMEDPNHQYQDPNDKRTLWDRMMDGSHKGESSSSWIDREPSAHDDWISRQDALSNPSNIPEYQHPTRQPIDKKVPSISQTPAASNNTSEKSINFVNKANVNTENSSARTLTQKIKNSLRTPKGKLICFGVGSATLLGSVLLYSHFKKRGEMPNENKELGR